MWGWTLGDASSQVSRTPLAGAEWYVPEAEGQKGLGHDGGTGNTQLCLLLYLFQHRVHGKNINFRFRIISILVPVFYHESAV